MWSSSEEVVMAATEPRIHEGLSIDPGIDVGEASDLADLFRLLGDPGRVRILFALLAAGELRVSDLAARVGMAETSVSHALRLLRTAGIVRNRRAGRNVHYALDDDHVRLLLSLSREHLRHETDAPR
jgi:ArsR family transcriptional regulator, lead/cadmium/zinc/bismuth-responsive transcriptional repressor